MAGADTEAEQLTVTTQRGEPHRRVPAGPSWIEGQPHAARAVDQQLGAFDEQPTADRLHVVVVPACQQLALEKKCNSFAVMSIVAGYREWATPAS